MAKKHVKKCSKSLMIREMQIKTTMRYHLILVRKATINKSTNDKCWQGCGKKGILVHCWWKCRLVQPLWKTVWSFLKKIKMGPNQFGSVDRASACRLKGPRFDSSQGHVPWLRHIPSRECAGGS
uniref:Uncharacterized protein n=1 Tax=Myotis myotis TaxID=51298 RepID=A0A7J7ZXH5_MYOMY|nr:hypothetical protein mMyoMyo1_009826 [Myotis myotis]